MKKCFSLLAFSFFTLVASAQDMTKFKLYKPEENAEKALEEVVEKAKDENKHVFVQIGGNWCVWCARFEDFVKSDPSIDSLVKENYLVYHLNHSKENKNTELLERFKFPQRFGFPVFLILNGKGELLHTQNSAYLEAGKGYDREKVMGFFKDWTREALDPKQYRDQ